MLRKEVICISKLEYVDVSEKGKALMQRARESDGLIRVETTSMPEYYSYCGFFAAHLDKIRRDYGYTMFMSDDMTIKVVHPDYVSEK